ncbi:MAG: hypothetical protein ACRD0J_08255 [Acidimicrobiales bacterium]
MRRAQIERRLFEVSDRLNRSRAELVVVDEQLRALSEAAEEARVRALVSETPVANRELQETRRHAEAMARSREAAAATVASLERTMDDLLERLTSSSG